jgi:hypothetical protein
MLENGTMNGKRRVVVSVQSNVSVNEVTYGLATDLELFCSQCDFFLHCRNTKGLESSQCNSYGTTNK